MNIKQLVFSAFLLLAPLRVDAQTDSVAAPDSGATGTDRYYSRVHRYRKHWAALIPTQFVWQFAGNMGFLSAGVGWNYGRRAQWETNLLFGYLPKYNSGRAKTTMTLKQNFVPWNIYIGKGWFVEPLTCGLYINTVFGPEFWGKQPDRYPDRYYPLLSTEGRVNIFVGQRIGAVTPKNRRKFIKDISLFYEISTCDLYLRSIIQDGNVSLWDILGLSLGLKFQVF